MIQWFYENIITIRGREFQRKAVRKILLGSSKLHVLQWTASKFTEVFEYSFARNMNVLNEVLLGAIRENQLETLYWLEQEFGEELDWYFDNEEWKFSPYCSTSPFEAALQAENVCLLQWVADREDHSTLTSTLVMDSLRNGRITCSAFQWLLDEYEQEIEKDNLVREGVAGSILGDDGSKQLALLDLLVERGCTLGHDAAEVACALDMPVFVFEWLHRQGCRFSKRVLERLAIPWHESKLGFRTNPLLAAMDEYEAPPYLQRLDARNFNPEHSLVRFHEQMASVYAKECKGSTSRAAAAVGSSTEVD